MSKVEFIKSGFKSLIKYFLILCLLAFLCIPMVYYFASQRIQTPSDHPLYEIFQTQQYKNVKKNLDSSKKSLIYGKDKEQILHFVEHYTHLKSKKFKIIKWDSSVSSKIHDYIPVSLVKKTLEQYINWEKNGKSIWIIELTKDNNQISQIHSLLNLYRQDSFIIISDSNIKILRFKAFQLPDLTEKKFYQVLSKKLKIGLKSAQILTNYFGSISQTIKKTDSNFKVDDLLKENFRQWNNDHTDSIKNKLKILCQQGKLKAKKPNIGLDTMGAFFYDEFYYWRSRQSLLNYQLLTQRSDCNQFTLLQIPETQIPPQPSHTQKSSSQKIKESQISQQKPVKQKKKVSQKEQKPKKSNSSKAKQAKVKDQDEKNEKIDKKSKNKNEKADKVEKEQKGRKDKNQKVEKTKKIEIKQKDRKTKNKPEKDEKAYKQIKDQKGKKDKVQIEKALKEEKNKGKGKQVKGVKKVQKKNNSQPPKPQFTQQNPQQVINVEPTVTPISDQTQIPSDANTETPIQNNQVVEPENNSK